MNWLDQVGQMFGGGQQQPQQIDNPYQNQMALQNAQMQKQRAMQMQDAQYQGGGAVGILAGLAQILKGKSLDRKADESITQALGRQFEFDNQRAMKEAERQAAEDEKRWQRELAKIRETEKIKAENRPVDPYQAWLAQQSPDTIHKAFAVKAGLEARPGTAPVVNVNTGGPAPTEFQKALDKKDAAYFGELRDAATLASQTLDQAKVIEDMMGSAETGKVPQALAMAGQYFGSEAGANMQTFQAATNRMVLDLAGKMKGALSDSDRRMLEQSVPSFGMDPRANKVVLDLIKKGAMNAQSTYKAADQYATENKGLRGFVPPVALNISLPQAPGYQVGQIIDLNGRKYRVTGGDPADPDLEEVK